ncbi:AMP-binding protein [Ideonella sp. DXS22W]|uniref:AMP-binding protein n=1 Tax=Pseudaquabacterium inlustre TaxID=2984192 RepID=A0ABU9CKH2_9BURK
MSLALSLPARAAQLSLYGLFQQQVARHPQRVALSFGDQHFSYRQLAVRVQALARQLLAMGLRRGDRIALLSENRSEYVEFELAAARLGLILACQNWRQSDEELTHCIRLVTPALLVHSGRQAAAIARLDHGVGRVLDLDAGGYEAWLAAAEARAGLDDAALDPDLDPECGLVILYTSGTTGLPKGALISQRAMLARAMVGAVDLGGQPGDAFIAWAPLFHMVSTDSVYATLVTGGHVIVMDGLDVPELVAITARTRIGHLTLMPGMVDRVIDEIERTGLTPKGARSIGCMADLVPLAQIQRVTTLYGAPFLNSFGSTETGAPPASRHTIAVGSLPERLSKQQNTYVQIKLVDEDDAEVPDGQPGEMCVRGPTLFSGYWANDAATARDFRGGWFHMGDVFVRNPDGTLDFVDRRKYLIKSGGENIYPAEIERVLMGHPQVAEAVVVRQPDPKWGEVPVAFVARLDESLTADDLKALCRGRIAGYKQPKDVIFIAFEAFPRSTTGKVKRHELELMLPKP